MLINASGKPDPLQIQVTVDGTTSFAAHSLHGTMSCLSLTLFILSTSNDAHKPLAEVEIIVFVLCSPEIMNDKNCPMTLAFGGISYKCC